MDNLSLWSKVRETNPKFTKKLNKGGIAITAINAITQIKKATEMWGSYGSTWGLRDLKYSYIDIAERKLCLLSAVFYYPNGLFEINSSITVSYRTNKGEGYLKVDDDFVKKIETDTLTKALSKLGFNADVFSGQYDDNKYVYDLNEKYKSIERTENKAKTEKFLNVFFKDCTQYFSDCKDEESVKSLYSEMANKLNGKNLFNEVNKSKLIKLANDAKESLTKDNTENGSK